MFSVCSIPATQNKLETVLTTCFFVGFFFHFLGALSFLTLTLCYWHSIAFLCHGGNGLNLHQGDSGCILGNISSQKEW